MSGWGIDIKCPCCGSEQTAGENHSTVIRGTDIVESSINCYNCGLEVVTQVTVAHFQPLEEVNQFRKEIGLRQLKKLAKPGKNFNIDEIETYIP